MLTMRDVRRRRRAAQKLMQLPENQEALRKGLERLKRYAKLALVRSQTVCVAEPATHRAEREVGKTKAARRQSGR